MGRVYSNLNMRKGANAMNSFKKRLLLCMIWLLAVSFPFMAAQAEDQPAAPADQQAPAPAAAPTATAPSVVLSTDVLSQYIFRGTAQSRYSAVIQPSGTVTYNGFSLNVWGNFDTARSSSNPFMVMPANQQGHGKWSETDVNASYTKELCPNFSVLIGNIYYALQPPISNFDEDEVYGGVSYNFPWLTVAFVTYGEVTHSADVWNELDLSKSIPVDCLCKGATLDLGASFGYLTLFGDSNILSLAEKNGLPAKTGDFSGFDTCQLTADVKFPITKCLSISPKVGLWLPLTDAASDYLQANSLDERSTHYYAGVNATVSF
jgi:hypothetical protein